MALSPRERMESLAEAWEEQAAYLEGEHLCERDAALLRKRADQLRAAITAAWGECRSAEQRVRETRSVGRRGLCLHRSEAP